MQLIKKAQNRLYKFYNPVLYKAPPKRELTEEEAIAKSAGFGAPPASASFVEAGGLHSTVITRFRKRSLRDI